MEQIRSGKNQTFQRLLKLAKSASRRREAGVIIFDGVKLITDYLNSGGQLDFLIADESKLSKITLPLINSSMHTRQISLAPDLFKRISQVETSSGLVGVTKAPRYNLADFDMNQSESIVLLDCVQDPNNLGAILRSCLAFGVTNVFLSAGSVDAWSPKVIRSSAGACFSLRVYENTSLVELVKSLQRAGYQVLATSPSAKKTIQTVNFLNQPTAWVFGNEGSGVSETLMGSIGDRVSIPQSGQLESLNLAASVAICLYEQNRINTDRSN